MVKVKKKSGEIVNYPVSKVKSMLKTVGYSGGLLVKGTGEVLNEAKNLLKGESLQLQI